MTTPGVGGAPPSRVPDAAAGSKVVAVVVVVAAAADLGRDEVQRNHEEEDAEDGPDDDAGNLAPAETARLGLLDDDDGGDVRDGGHVSGLVLGLDGELDGLTPRT